MASEYNHKNPSYETRYVSAQTQDFVTVNHERKKANPIYKNDISFFTSPVKNSNLYPNMTHIRPFNLDYRPTNIGKFLDKSIQENKKYAFGPYILENREINYKS